MNKQNIINKFCCTIGMLPTSYKVSLTYEEQILAIGNYLDEVVFPAINNNAAALEELQGLFTELKNYVDDYFEDLDVQEEIDNKLDEMADSGELQEIMAEYLNLKAVFCFNTVEDMKEATNLQEGSFAMTYGFNSINDGGRSFYKVRTITTSDTINNADIIKLDNSETLICELQVKDSVNPIQFGCYGDGETDDYDNMIKCLTYCSSNHVALISPKNKIYAVSDSLNMGEVNTMWDWQNSTIKALNNTSTTGLVRAITSYQSNNSLRNLIIDCNNVCEVGLYSNWAWSTLLENIMVLNPYSVGIKIDGGNFRMKNIKIFLDNDTVREVTGLYINGATDGNYENVVCRNCFIGIRNSGASNTFRDCHPSMFTTALLPNSKAFYIEASTNLESCFADTYEYGFYMTNETGSRIINPRCFVNTNFYNDETMQGVAPKFMYFTNVNGTRKMVVSGLSSINTTAPVTRSNVFYL